MFLKLSIWENPFVCNLIFKTQVNVKIEQNAYKKN